MPSGMKEHSMRALVQQYPRLLLKNGVLHRRQADQRCGTLEQLVLPSSIRPDVLASLHDGMGHQGYERTMELLRPCVYWPALYKKVKDYISSCERCTMGRAPVLHTASSRLLASRSLELLATEFIKFEIASDGREKLMFLFSPMFSRSSPRPYRRATRRQGKWPRCRFTSGFNATGSPRRSTVTRVGTLNLSWWKPCLSSMVSRRPGPLRTTPVATHSASDSIARCMICFEPCPRNRSPSGHSTSRSLWRRITIRLMLPRGFCLLFGQERQHRLRLQDSHARALKHLQEAAAERRKQTDQKAADHPWPLHVGALVYLRNRVLGRSKIQDRWRPELKFVTARPYPGIHVYGVKPFSGGQERSLSRDDLLPARAPLTAAAEEPTQEALIGVISGWVGLWLFAVKHFHRTHFCLWWSTIRLSSFAKYISLE